MKYLNSIGAALLLLSLAACSQNTEQTSSANRCRQKRQQRATVINLTQVGCQFLEVEAQNYQYSPKKSADCEEINAKTLANRESGFKPLELKPGKYIFRVTNSNVPYKLGFYLRGEEGKKSSLPDVSGGGLTKDVTKDYEIDLVAGKYVFSCPLNPTPDYPIVVN